MREAFSASMALRTRASTPAKSGIALLLAQRREFPAHMATIAARGNSTSPSASSTFSTEGMARRLGWLHAVTVIRGFAGTHDAADHRGARRLQTLQQLQNGVPIAAAERRATSLRWFARRSSKSLLSIARSAPLRKVVGIRKIVATPARNAARGNQIEYSACRSPARSPQRSQRPRGWPGTWRRDARATEAGDIHRGFYQPALGQLRAGVIEARHVGDRFALERRARSSRA